MAGQIAYSYIRFSSPQQAAGDSFRRQIEDTRAYCKSRNMILDESLNLHDRAVSGYTGKNLKRGNALARFLDACADGGVAKGSALVVENLDRLTRQTPRKALRLLLELLIDFAIDIHVTSISEPKVYLANSPSEGEDLMMAVGSAIRANNESAVKADRLQKAWAKKRAITSTTKAFMGAELPWWLILKKGKIKCPPARRAVVLEIFKLTSAGNSSAKIARWLNEHKRPTWRRQKRWTSMRVRGLVRSRGPEGVLRATPKTVKAGREYPEINGYYPVIVEPGLAKTARAVLKQNDIGGRGRPPKHKRPINLFRGLLRYKERWTRHATNQNGTRDPATKERSWNSYYECFDELGAVKNGKLLLCISGKQLEPVVFAGLSELKPSDLAPARPDTFKMKLARIETEIRDLRKRVRHLLNAIEHGSPAVAKRCAELEIELADKEKARDGMSPPRQAVSVPTKDFKALVENLRDPDIRERAADGLRRIATRIDIGRTFDDLPITDEFRRLFFKQHDKIISGAQTVQDPVKRNKRRKPLHILVTFASGGARYIGRVEGAADRLVSWKVEFAEPAA